MDDFPLGYKPKFIAQKCPVCNGFTTVGYGKSICQTCKGKGYIEIPVEEDRGQNENKNSTY